MTSIRLVTYYMNLCWKWLKENSIQQTINSRLILNQFQWFTKFLFYICFRPYYVYWCIYVYNPLDTNRILICGWRHIQVSSVYMNYHINISLDILFRISRISWIHISSLCIAFSGLQQYPVSKGVSNTYFDVSYNSVINVLECRGSLFACFQKNSHIWFLGLHVS